MTAEDHSLLSEGGRKPRQLAAGKGWTRPVLGDGGAGLESQLCPSHVLAGRGKLHLSQSPFLPLSVATCSTIHSFLMLLLNTCSMCLALSRGLELPQEQGRHTLEVHVLRQLCP